MTTGHFVFGALFVTVLSAHGHSAVAARSLRPPQKALEAGRISGIVSVAGVGSPLPRATIKLTGASLTAPIVALTADDGRFEIGGLAPGSYSLSASKPAYITAYYGATRRGGAGTPIVLAQGEQVTDLKVAVRQGAVISGSVISVGGEPVADAAITVLRRTFENGAAQWVNVRSAFANDRGEYRVWGLEAGDYLVLGQPFPDDGRIPPTFRLMTETGAAYTGGGVGGGGQAAARSLPPPFGFAPTFYPGVTDSRQASAISLAEADIRLNVNVAIQMVPMGQIHGTVQGQWPPNSPPQIVLQRDGPIVPDGAFGARGRLGPRTADSAGRFSFEGVPPGDYTIAAVTAGTSPSQDLGSGSQFSTASIAIAGATVAISLPLQPTMAVTGRLVVTDKQSPEKVTRFRLQLENVRPDGSGTVRRIVAEPSPDGTFRWRDLLPGRFVISLLEAPSAQWVLSSVRGNNRELLDAPFELTSGQNISDVIVTISQRPPVLSGSLERTSGVPAAEYHIVIFSVDPNYWFPSSRRSTAIRPDTRGNFSTNTLPTGEYFVAAVTDVEPGEWFDPEFLKSLQSTNPLRVSVAEERTTTMRLRVGSSGMR